MVRYREEQRLGRLSLVGILLLVAFAEAGAFAVIVFEYLHRPTMGPPVAALVAIGVAATIGPLLLLVMKLVVEVRDDGIYYCFFPTEWGFRCIAFTDIETMEIVSYHPILDFGGWGKRYRFWGKFKGICYTVGGDRALAVTKTDGRRIFLGTRRPDELLATVYDAAGAR